MDKKDTISLMDIQDAFARLSTEMRKTVSSLYLYDALMSAKSTDIEDGVGSTKAQMNARIMNRYLDFFAQTIESLRVTFVIGILKFYDKNQKALTFDWIKRNAGDLVQQEDKDKITVLEQGQKNVLCRLKTFRDQQVAHIDLQIEKLPINFTETEKLIRDTQAIFNVLQDRLIHQTTKFDHLERNARKIVFDLLDNLS